jgi:hypothetical protein
MWYYIVGGISVVLVSLFAWDEKEERVRRIKD